jgi:hypothetical protein
MQLFPPNTIRRSIFEFLDRSLGFIIYRTYRPVSDICGDIIVFMRRREELPGTWRCIFCSWICDILSKYVEFEHCQKNKGKA